MFFVQNAFQLIFVEYMWYKLEGTKIYLWKKEALKHNDNYYLSAEKVFSRFCFLVDKAVKGIREESKDLGESKLFVTFQSNNPAVTLKFYESENQRKDGLKPKYKVDLAPVIKVNTWPTHLADTWRLNREEETKEGNVSQKKWPSQKIVTAVCCKAVYLVPKLSNTWKNKELRPLLWRYAFNEGEKTLLLESDSGHPNNCRRNVLRILKGLTLDLGLNLKSYHMKTLLLHESERHPANEDWEDKMLKERVDSALLLLRNFIGGSKLKHYFVPSVNLFAELNLKPNVKDDIVSKIDKFLENPNVCLLWCKYHFVCQK